MEGAIEYHNTHICVRAYTSPITSAAINVRDDTFIIHPTPHPLLELNGAELRVSSRVSGEEGKDRLSMSSRAWASWALAKDQAV